MKLNRLVKTLIISFVVTVITLATSMLFKEMKEDCYIEYNVDISSDNLELDLLPDDNIKEITNRIALYANLETVSKYIGCFAGGITILLLIIYCVKKNQSVGKTKKVPNEQLEDELKHIKDLFDKGLITQEEFDAKKKQLLGL